SLPYTTLFRAHRGPDDEPRRGGRTAVGGTDALKPRPRLGAVAGRCQRHRQRRAVEQPVRHRTESDPAVLAVDGGTDDEAVGAEAVADFEQAAPRGPGSPDEVVGLDVGGHEFARPVEGRLGDPADVLLVFGV